MDADFIMELEELMNNGEFEAAVQKIGELDEEEMTTELYVTLAHALTQCGRYRDSLSVLQHIEADADENDLAYHMELAGAYYGLHRYRSAEQEARKCISIDEDIIDPWLLLALICQETGDTESFEQIEQTARQISEEAWEELFSDVAEFTIYEGDELKTLLDFIAENFGNNMEVFPFTENDKANHSAEVIIVPPHDGRDFYALVTVGMGSYRGTEVVDESHKITHRTEICAFLPGELKPEEIIKKYQWTARIMCQFSDMIQVEKSWLGPGHTISYGADLEPGLILNGVIFDMLDMDDLFPEDEDAVHSTCILPDGERVEFIQLFPIYEEEMLYKIDRGADSLFRKLRSYYYKDFFALDEERSNNEPSILTGIDVIHLGRKNVCENKAGKHRALMHSSLEQLLSWDGPDGCFATDRITVDGCKVGYMYREKPHPDYPDSGWRFLAGDESKEYMSDLSNMDIFSLNTICNYDIDIIEYLDSPTGSAFYRDKNGEFRKVK